MPAVAAGGIAAAGARGVLGPMPERGRRGAGWSEGQRASGRLVIGFGQKGCGQQPGERAGGETCGWRRQQPVASNILTLPVSLSARYWTYLTYVQTRQDLVRRGIQAVTFQHQGRYIVGLVEQRQTVREGQGCGGGTPWLEADSHRGSHLLFPSRSGAIQRAQNSLRVIVERNLSGEEITVVAFVNSTLGGGVSLVRD